MKPLCRPHTAIVGESIHLEEDAARMQHHQQHHQHQHHVTQPHASSTPLPQPAARTTRTGAWSTEEHERYLLAKYANPKASWKHIAILVGTRSARQVILHDQKFRMKMERRRTKGEQPVAFPKPASVEKGHTQRKWGIPEMRYIDSMGVLLLASVACTRAAKMGTTEESASSTTQSHVHEEGQVHEEGYGKDR